MSVTMARTDGVTMMTLTTDPESPCPPLCQILGHLCYNPLCCTVSQRYKSVQEDSQTALGTLQIMVGALNFSLGFILCNCGGLWSPLDGGWFPLWFGVLFMLCGIMCIWAERRPSPCLVYFSVILNLVGAVFALAAFILYIINIATIWMGWRCDEEYLPPEDPVYKKCIEGTDLLLMLMRCITGLLIILSVLELCVTISAAVLGIKTLKNSNRREN